MPSDLFKSMNSGNAMTAQNPLMQRFQQLVQFRQNMGNIDPKSEVMKMIQNGQLNISQGQLDQFQLQANEIMKSMRSMGCKI